MKRLTLLTLAASALALSACASLAPYGPQQGPNGQGYAEQRIESNRFRVTYRGVGAPGPVADMAAAATAAIPHPASASVSASMSAAPSRPRPFWRW